MTFRMGLAAATVVLISLLPCRAAAQTTGWVKEVSPGTDLSVVDDQGRVIRGRVTKVMPGSIEVAGTWQIDPARATRVVRHRDSIANGAGIGFVAGAVAGMAAVRAIDFCGFRDCAAGDYLGAGALVGLSGLTIGVLADLLTGPGNKVLLDATSSPLEIVALGARRQLGLGVSIRW